MVVVDELREALADLALDSGEAGKVFSVLGDVDVAGGALVERASERAVGLVDALREPLDLLHGDEPLGSVLFAVSERLSLV